MRASRKSHRDAILLALWLGFAGLLIWQPTLPSPQDPSPQDLEAPTAALPSLEESGKVEQAAATAFRQVQLPPPPPLSPPPAQAPKVTLKPLPLQERTEDSAEKPAPRPAAVTPPEPITVNALKAETSESTPRREDAADKQDQQPQAETPPPETPEEPQDIPRDLEPPREVTVGQVDAQEGRTLLRLLEHGEGPQIQLAWPDGPGERQALYSHLAACFGMTVAVIDETGSLYRHQDGRLLAWSPNMDLFSGFLRSPQGRLTEEERGHLQAARHSVPSARTVRLFHRRVDALLLGGIARLIGPDYGSLKSIQGRYERRGHRLAVRDLRGDGRAIAGSIDLTPAAGACRYARS